jgi:hypothetical protein
VVPYGLAHILLRLVFGIESSSGPPLPKHYLGLFLVTLFLLLAHSLIHLLIPLYFFLSLTRICIHRGLMQVAIRIFDIWFGIGS